MRTRSGSRPLASFEVSADPIESEWETDSIYVLIDAAQIDEALGSFNYGASLSD